MNDRIDRLLFLVLLVSIGSAGCQRSGSPSGENPAGSGAAAPATPPVQTVAPPPGSSSPGAPGAPGSLTAGPAAQPAGAPVKPVPAVLPSVVARVNGEDVLRWELEAALKQAEAAAGGPVPADKRDAVLRDLIDEIVTHHLLAQEARSRNMNVTDAELDAELAAIRKNFPTEETYQQALLLQGMTPDQLRQATRRGLQTQKLVDAEVTKNVAIQDAAVDAFYKENIDRFKQGDSVRASHIFIAVPPDAPATQRNQARAAAQELLKQLRAGADFAKLARENSDDPGSAENGGDLGFFEKGAMPPDFEAVAFALPQGQLSEVVELSSGIHIIKTTGTRGPRTAPLAEVRDNLKQFLLDSERQARLDALVGQLKARSKIEMLV